MNVRQTLGFNDWWLIAPGLPLLSFIIPVIFYESTPAELGWGGFAPHWLVSALYTATYWSSARYIIAFWRQRCPGRARTSQRVAKSVGSLVVLVTVVEVACRIALGWGDLLRAADFEWSQHGFLRTAPVSMLVALGMMAVYEAVYFFGLYRTAELERERLLRAQVELHLDVLSKQVDPHFLFNSLNTLAAVIPEDPAGAVRFTQRLSAVYRRLLDWRHAGTVTVAEELVALADYRHLLEVRFEGRLQIDVDVDPALHGHTVVPLALQLLVENAVKHNEASRSRPLRVVVRGQGESLIVEHALQSKPVRERSSGGFGLQNLRDRLSYLGGRPLTVDSDGGHFRVAVPVYAPALLGPQLAAG